MACLHIAQVSAGIIGVGQGLDDLSFPAEMACPHIAQGSAGIIGGQGLDGLSLPDEMACPHIPQGSTYLIRFHHLLCHRKDGLDVALGKFVCQLAHGWVVLEREDSLSDKPSRTRPG